jgi:predicted permease
MKTNPAIIALLIGVSIDSTNAFALEANRNFNLKTAIKNLAQEEDDGAESQEVEDDGAES